MESFYTLITWSVIPGFFVSGYADKLKLNQVHPVRDGVLTTEIRTENPEAASFDSLYIPRLIQSTNYDKYTLQFIATEHMNVEMITQAQTISIYSTAEQRYYDAKIINLTFEKVFNTPNRKYTLEFYDVNADNYPNGLPIITPLRSDVLTTWQGTSSLTRVQLVVGGTSYNYYTALVARLFPGENENQKETELNGKKIISRVTIKTKRRVVLYLNDADTASFALYAPQCVDQFTCTIGSNTNLEQPNITVEQVAGGIDLNKVTLEITSVLNDKYPLT